MADAAAYEEPIDAPDNWTDGDHLFVDDYLVAEHHPTVTRTTHPPTKYGSNPVVIKGPEAWHEQPLFYCRVFESGGSWELYYNVKNSDAGVIADGAETCFAYATSADGQSWAKPNLGIVTIDGDASTNVFRKSGVGELDLGMDVLTEGPGIVGPDTHACGWNNNGSANGYHVAFAPDGLNFVEASPGALDRMGDIFNLRYDAVKGNYIGTFKYDSYPYEFSTTRRDVGQNRTSDLLNWSAMSSLIIRAEKADGVREFYGMRVIQRGELYLGFLRILRDDLPAHDGGGNNGIGWTVLATSRDGENWYQWNDAFLDRNPTNPSWDHAMAWFGDIITVSGTEYIYYGGYDQGHKVGDRQLGLATLTKNRFVSRDGVGSYSRLLTRTRIWQAGKSLTINCAVTGALSIRPVTPDGAALGPYVTPGSGTDTAVAWDGSVYTAMEGLPIAFEILLNNAELYGVSVV